MIPSEISRVRIDKWLWAARFFKTRSLAAAAVDAGKVQANGERAKPAKLIKPGDMLSIRSGPYVWHITVVELSERRGPAADAAKLYSESADSCRIREETRALIKSERRDDPFSGGRPTKKARRQIIRFLRQQEE
jgi:ribosome-associated heat shock protein Hsp15